MIISEHFGKKINQMHKTVQYLCCAAAALGFTIIAHSYESKGLSPISGVPKFIYIIYITNNFISMLKQNQKFLILK